MPDVIRLRAVYRFAGAPSLLPSAAPVRPRVRHVVYCPECHSDISAEQSRPRGLNADVAHAAARMSIPADSIRLSQGCLPAVLFRFSVYAPHIYVRHIFFS